MLKESIDFKALGTDINIQVVFDSEKERKDIREDFLEIEDFYRSNEKIFSRFDPESELFGLNGRLGEWRKASCDIIEIAKKSLCYNELSGGVFDPRVIDILEKIGYKNDFKKNRFNVEAQYLKIAEIGIGGKQLEEDLEVGEGKILLRRRMDFSGIVKGYVTDKAASLLWEKGRKNVLVDSGGDIRTSGFDQEGKNWRISIEGVEEKKLIVKLTEKFSAIATSGIGRRKWENKAGRFHHLIDPKNPEHFDFNLRSVTVIEKTAEEADFWAKVLFISGKEEGLKLSEERGVKSIFLDSRGNVYASRSIKENTI